MRCVYDIETYPNVFTFGCSIEPGGLGFVFEISEFKNESKALSAFLKMLVHGKHEMVGYNNYAFDYPLLHLFIQSAGRMRAIDAYNLCQSIIKSNDHTFSIPPWEHYLPQIDLYRIHHFNNRARATSLKTLQFNMRMSNVSDLPFPVGSTLNPAQIEVLKEYNLHDVEATTKFMGYSEDAIALRLDLGPKLDLNLINQSDVSIGVKIAVNELDKVGVQCYHYVNGNKEACGTERPKIDLRDCILPWIKFFTPQLQTVLNFLKNQTITETKGVFKGLTAECLDFKFVFGLGGLHGSVESQVIHANDEYTIIDIDVEGYYPNLIIKQGFYPEHLTEKFCPVYKGIKDKRADHPKGTPENAAYKLATNGVYGQSGAPFSPFYDPKFMMQTTLNGQLLLCMLAEKINDVHRVSIIQANTDGLTVRLPRSAVFDLTNVVSDWETLTGLKMEYTEYKTMCIRDVNSYIAIGVDDNVKEKGAYVTNPEWHKDHSKLIVPKVAKLHLLHGYSIKETVENWSDPMDFMLRAKIPRNYDLLLHRDGLDVEQQRTCRYYVSKKGGELIKQMPPLPTKVKAGDSTPRRNQMVAGRKVTIANDLTDVEEFDFDYDYYIQEVEKLVLGLC